MAWKMITQKLHTQGSWEVALPITKICLMQAHSSSYTIQHLLETFQSLMNMYALNCPFSLATKKGFLLHYTILAINYFKKECCTRFWVSRQIETTLSHFCHVVVKEKKDRSWYIHIQTHTHRVCIHVYMEIPT